MNIGIAPDKRGHLHDNDVKNLREFKKLLDRLRAHPVSSPELPFNLVEMEEDLSIGEQVCKYEVSIRQSGVERTILKGNSIGIKRIRLLEEAVSGNHLKLNVLRTVDHPVSVSMKLYHVESPVFLKPEVSAENTPDPGCLELKVSSASQDGNAFKWNLKKTMNLVGIRLTPLAGNPGTPENYSIKVSQDGVTWESVVTNGSFDNIAANPIPQTVKFALAQSRYICLEVLRTINPAAQSATFQSFCILILPDETQGNSN